MFVLPLLLEFLGSREWEKVAAGSARRELG
jgi:hypothetical protein